MNKMTFIRSAANQAVPQSGGEDAIDLRLLENFVKRRWRLIVLVTFMTMLVTLVGLFLVTPRYTATAEILLDPAGQKTFGESILPEFSLETANVDSQISVLLSVNLLRHVVQRFDLTKDDEFGRPPKPNIFAMALNFIRNLDKIGQGSSKPILSGDKYAIPDDELIAIGQLNEAIDVQRYLRTYVLTVSVTSIDSAKAARIANEIADVYIDDQLDARYEGARRAATWLAERETAVLEEMRKSEQALSDFRRDHNLLAISEDSNLTVGQQQISDLNVQLANARATTAEAKAKYEQAAAVLASKGNIEANSDVVRSPLIAQLRTQEAEISRREADLLSRYTPQNPQVVDIRAEHQDISQSIAREVGRIVSNLRDDYEIAKARENSMQETIKHTSVNSGLDDTVGLQLRELERRNTANKEFYAYVQNRSKIAQEQSNFEQQQARLITPAIDPVIPSFPKKTSSEALATIVGFMLGIGAGIAMDLLNAGFLTTREVEEKLGLPVLGAAPVLRARDRMVKGKQLDPVAYCIQRPLSRYAEAIRSVRVGLQMVDVDNPVKVVMLTSAVPGEGKTTSVTALAYSAQRAGFRVILVDCDLRHPAVTRYFGLNEKRGVTDILTGKTGLEESLIEIDGLIVLPAGGKTQNSADLLGSERMRLLVARLREEYDYVFLDAAPLAPVIDPRILASLVDKIIFVVRWSHTQREIVTQCLESLEEKAKIAGVLLNLIDERKVPKYGKYASYTGQGYHNYYEK